MIGTVKNKLALGSYSIGWTLKNETSLTRYDKYKDSGVDWLSEIPVHWEVKRLKYLCCIYTGYTPPTDNKSNFDEEGVLWVKPNNLEGLKYIYETEEKVSLTAIRNGFLIPVDSILVCSIGTIGKIGIAGANLITNQQINSLVFNKNVNTRFSKYMVFNAEKVFDQLSNGNVVKIINTSTQKEIKFCLPPVLEQESISNFLDDKCEKIDAAVSLKEQQIEKLKELRQITIHKAVTTGVPRHAEPAEASVPMKDSGIDWIGKIPEHWEVKRLKRVLKAQGRIGFKGYSTSDLVSAEKGALVLGASHMDWNGNLKLDDPVYLSWHKYYESPEIMVNKGDIVIVQRGSTCGKVSLIINDLGSVTINPSLVLLKNIRMNNFFCFLAIKCSLQYILGLMSKTAIPMISQEQINNISIPIPPLSEQQAIATYLEEQTFKIDKAITQKQEQIVKLKEYKQSLINEAVTGKIKITA